MMHILETSAPVGVLRDVLADQPAVIDWLISVTEYPTATIDGDAYLAQMTAAKERLVELGHDASIRSEW